MELVEAQALIAGLGQQIVAIAGQFVAAPHACPDASARVGREVGVLDLESDDLPPAIPMCEQGDRLDGLSATCSGIADGPRVDGANPLPARYNEQVASRAAFQR